MIDDERPTPELGYPVQSVRGRARTPSNGVPIFVAPERPSRRMRTRPDTDELDVDAEIERAFDVLLKRRMRPYRWLIGIVATAAIGSGGGAIKGAIDGARASERDRVLIETLRDEVKRIRDERDDERAARRRSSRRDELPGFPPADPALKGQEP